MDHTVYERKNTDLGSTSMTKSGGFSIKKRHRKLGALIGLAALAVPFAANLGTLGDAIHAVTGPQNVYESELLNVKLKTSQDKTKTTWDLEFDRSDMKTVSEQTVKFKLDLEKAGLKDAEIAVKDGDKLGDPLDMREGIVSAVLKTQSTHLILTAISTNEDKHDITLPVTELGLYNEENGENLLPADNRSVDLTMAFEKVAEIAKESSSSETVTEAVAKEEEKAEDKQGEKAHRVVPNVATGYIALGSNDPMTSTSLSSLPEIDNVQNTYIDKNARTSPVSGGTTTDGQNFQLWSNGTSANTVYHNDNNANFNNRYAINVYQKFDVADGTIDGQRSENGTNGDPTPVRTEYHDQYQLVNGSNNNQSAYTIEFTNGQDAAMENAKFEIFYDNVGYYIDEYGAQKPMGAVMTIGNIQPSSADHTRLGDMRFIDLPNNLYSGILYHGIDHLDLTIQFYAVDSETHQFTGLINVGGVESDTRFTFASLNNFGLQGKNTGWNGNNTGDGNWNTQNTNIDNHAYAEYVQPVTRIGGTPETAIIEDAETAKSSPATGSQDSSMKRDGNIWYSTAHGVYKENGSFKTVSNANWKDDITDTDTFQKGSVSFSATGTANTYRLFTGTGNTWQTLTCASNQPVQLNAPRKLVMRDNDTTAPAAAYSATEALKNSVDKSAAALIQSTREKFTNDWKAANPGVAYNTQFYVDREEAVNTALSTAKNGENYVYAYGDLFDQDLAHTSTSLINDKPYFTYDYWIMQPTYAIGTASIVKPQDLQISDLLPLDVSLQTVEATDSDDGTDAAASVKLFNTNGGTFTYGTDYSITVTPGTGNDAGRQNIVVKMTAVGMQKAIFNGGDLALDLDVKVDAHLTDDNKRHDFLNMANVETKLTHDAGGVDTNIVPVHIIPKPEATLQLTKQDDKGNNVRNANFTLTRVADPKTWVFNETTGTGTWTDWDYDITPVPVKPTEFTPGDSAFTWNGLEIGEYELVEPAEDVPGGYVGLTQPVKFRVTGQLTSKDEKFGSVIEPVDDYSKNIIDNWKAVTTSTGTGWTGVIVNPQEKVKFEMNKVDDDQQPLDGAAFKFGKYDTQTKTVVGVLNPMEKGSKTGNFQMPETDLNDTSDPKKPFYLDYNQVYVVQETEHPSGYAMIGDFYFIVVPKNNYGSYPDVPNKQYFNADRDVSFLQVDQDGAPIQWLPATYEKGTNTAIWTGSFNVQNSAKSIFPRVGGTGIQAYIGAGLIVMLIAGGAAWYIKRRQNQ